MDHAQADLVRVEFQSSNEHQRLRFSVRISLRRVPVAIVLYRQKNYELEHSSHICLRFPGPSAIHAFPMHSTDYVWMNDG